MKAAVLFAENQPLDIVEVELAPPGPGEVRVRLAATGICASDWHTATGAIPAPTPAVLGHEGAGVVDAVGDGVRSVAPGDHVVLSWVPSCGHCRYCDSGRPNLCSVAAPLLAGTLVSGGRRLSYRREPLYHYSFLSTFAEHGRRRGQLRADPARRPAAGRGAGGMRGDDRLRRRGQPGQG
jgi:Zn-dependent alcohol dehydrogenase